MVSATVMAVELTAVVSEAEYVSTAMGLESPWTLVADSQVILISVECVDAES